MSVDAVVARIAQLNSVLAPQPVAAPVTATSTAQTAAPANATFASLMGQATTGATGVATVGVIFPNVGLFTTTASFLNAAGFFADHTGAVPAAAETATSTATLAPVATVTSVIHERHIDD